MPSIKFADVEFPDHNTPSPYSIWRHSMPSIFAQKLWKQKLVAALAAADAGPSASDLVNAPALNHWRAFVTPKGSPFLFGLVSGHPRLGSRWITTSQLVGINPAHGWARTASRWYQLSCPFADLEAKVARGLGVSDAGPDFLQVGMPGCPSLDDMTKLSLLLSAWRNRILQADGDRHV